MSAPDVVASQDGFTLAPEKIFFDWSSNQKMRFFSRISPPPRLPVISKAQESSFQHDSSPRRAVDVAEGATAVSARKLRCGSQGCVESLAAAFLAEAGGASRGQVGRPALGCCLGDGSCRDPARFTGRTGGREVREASIVRAAQHRAETAQSSRVISRFETPNSRLAFRLPSSL